MILVNVFTKPLLLFFSFSPGAAFGFGTGDTVFADDDVSPFLPDPFGNGGVDPAVGVFVFVVVSFAALGVLLDDISERDGLVLELSDFERGATPLGIGLGLFVGVRTDFTAFFAAVGDGVELVFLGPGGADVLSNFGFTPMDFSLFTAPVFGAVLFAVAFFAVSD